LKVELLLCRWIERSRADLELREVVGEKKRKEISLVLARKKKARQQKVRKRKAGNRYFGGLKKSQNHHKKSGTWGHKKIQTDPLEEKRSCQGTFRSLKSRRVPCRTA
jgi:hypothetical protein